MKTCCSLIYFFCGAAVFAQTATPASDPKAALLDRVKHGEYHAMLDAGRTGDTNFIPYLEGQATGGLTDPSTQAAKMALAKLGVKKYLDEAVAELTTTNSALFALYRTNGFCAFPSQESRALCATEKTQEPAFGKLAYIRNVATIKIVAQFLYSTRVFYHSQDVPPSSTAGNAYMALRQMVDNPPPLPAVHTHEEELLAWQQWWEQNKSNYP